MATDGGPAEVPLGFGGATASAGAHIAHFYRGDSEQFSVLGPYIAEGLGREERCAVISSPETAQRFRAWLHAEGVDAAESERTGRLFLHPGEATRGDMQALFKQMVAQGKEAGYEVIRLAGDGGGALAGRTSVSEMLRWEALYDQIADGLPIIALCQFDLTRFGGDVVMDALRSHPLCVMGQVLVHNALHVDPADLLEEMAEWA